MSRKRLTAATLQDRKRHASSEQAADLAFRLLGPAASDKELITAGATLHRSLGPKALSGVHLMASRIAQETGEDFPGPDANEGPPQPEPEETQNYVEEHVAAPDHVVLDTVVNKLSPTVDPTASSRAAADDDEDDADMPDVEDPEDVEGGDDDYVEDESDEFEDLEDSGDMEDEDMEDPEEDYSESMDDEPGLDDFMDDSDDMGGDDVGSTTSSDQGGSEDYYDNPPEDDREFSVSDLEALQDLGVEEVPGVMASSKKKNRNGKRAASRQQQFRPSRTRTASRAGDGDEFEGIFGTPDLGDMFLH